MRTVEERKSARAEYQREYQRSLRTHMRSKPYFYEVKGKPFRDARERMGVSMNAAGKAIGLSTTNIWNWENGFCSPNPENLKKIADYYGVEPKSLLA